MESLINQVCYQLVTWIPYENLRDPSYTFMHRAFAGMLLLSPLCVTIGIQVVNFRMAFFAEAVGHSAFTGIALGFLLALASGVTDSAGMDGPALVTMILFGVFVGVLITFFRQRTSLASDTVIGVFSAAIMALGIALITHMSRTSQLRGNTTLQSFLLGNILTITEWQIAGLFVFFIAASAFQYFAYNRLLFIGVNSALARTRGIAVNAYEYAFSCLLALVVMFSIKVVGALLVTAMLVIPAAAARNLARSAGGIFWWGQLVAVSSGVGGLILSDYFETATGATAVLLATVWFGGSSTYSWIVGRD